MSFKSALKTYHTQRWKNLHRLLKQYIKNYDHETLHKARVETKKINALFHFFEAADSSIQCSRQLNGLNKIFKACGQIRDHRNFIKLCDEYGVKISALKNEPEKSSLKHLEKKYHTKNSELLEAEADGNKAIKQITTRSFKHTPPS